MLAAAGAVCVKWRRRWVKTGGTDGRRSWQFGRRGEVGRWWVMNEGRSVPWLKLTGSDEDD